MAHSPLAHPLDPHFRRNVLGISLVEFLWGLGMPPVIESTFLQLFLRHFGASSLLIGLIPTLAAAGTAFSGLLSYSLTGHLERKRTAVILVHVTTALPMLVFGSILGFTGFRSATLGLFLALYAFFSIAAGLLLPVWQNYLMKIFSEKRAVPAMAVMMTAQSVAKLLGSLLLVRVVERYAFSASGVSLIFTLVGAIFIVGSLPFLFTVEEAGMGARSAAVGHGHKPSLAELLRNRAFLVFLGTDLEYFALSGVIAFYANYATEFRGIDPALASGLFMAFTYVGAVLANGLLGWANLFSLRTKYLVTKALATAGLVLMAFHAPPWVFYLVSLLFGASRGTRLMVFTPVVKRLSGHADATFYFAVAPVLALPLSTCLPLLNGAFLDRFASLGAVSYRIVFLAMAALSLGGLFFAARMRRE
jgi:hypothetical protein